MEEAPKPNSALLLQLVRVKMPYGKYKDTLLCDIPIYYLEWMNRKGFPKSKLGEQLATVYEIKLNGLTEIFYQLKKM